MCTSIGSLADEPVHHSGLDCECCGSGQILPLRREDRCSAAQPARSRCRLHAVSPHGAKQATAGCSREHNLRLRPWLAYQSTA